MHETLPDDPADEARRRLKAIGLMVIALVLFSGLDASAKYLATYKGLPVTQIVWVRFVVQFVLLLVLVPAFGLLGLKELFTTQRLAQQIARSFLMVGTTAFNFLALKYLRLDQTITVVFLAPLVVALLAGPVLGEWVGWRRFVAILVGFLGIVIAVRPGFTAVHPAVGYAFGAPMRCSCC
jgi:drug/metabolite transporter (DMT)-like permease